MSKPINLDNLNNLPDDKIDHILSVRKKPVVVHAVQVNVPFKVTTLEGVVQGKAGDYLMIGIDGEKYPCRQDIFERTYDILEEPSNA